MVLGDHEHQQVFGALPVRFTEFPEAAADTVKTASRHVHRTEPAVRCEVRRAELLGPPAGERLALIAPGEQRQLARLARADRAQPGCGERQRLLPLDLLEVAAAALASAQQRLA